MSEKSLTGKKRVTSPLNHNFIHTFTFIFLLALTDLNQIPGSNFLPFDSSLELVSWANFKRVPRFTS